jgi:hypothetical protein
VLELVCSIPRHAPWAVGKMPHSEPALGGSIPRPLRMASLPERARRGTGCDN